MSLTRADFATFFAEINNGSPPYPWQHRLLDHLLAERTWPDRLVAPTGAGKTSIVDVHVFANALHSVGQGPRVPRRLAMVVDRRVVVDSHDEHARAIADRLAGTSDGIVAEVADALLRLTADGPALTAEGRALARQPLVTTRIRGGSPVPRGWLDQVDSCAVLACTPDMWGSRLLLRGYGSSRRAYPRAAGLLAMDAAVVVDEAHLSRQLLMTARRVAELQAAAPHSIGVPVLQVVEATATPDPGDGLTEVGVESDDLSPEEPLTDRMTRPKPVRLMSVPEWPVPKSGPGRRAAVTTIADRVAHLRAGVEPSDETSPTIGCVLDTVALAVDVAENLRSRGLIVEVIVGRLRPADVEEIRRRRSGLLGPKGNREVDVLVATQTIEVGIDLDLAGMVTELAPGTALAQRAGRVNRAGRRSSGPVTVVVPGPAGVGDTKAFPYDGDDLEAALRWVSRIATRPDGLAPWSVRSDPPPSAQRRRMVWSRLEHADSWQLARTSEDQFAEPFLDLWLADELDTESDVGLVARVLPDDEIEAVELLRLTAPEPHEVYPVAIGSARALIGPLVDDENSLVRPLLVRAHETSVLSDAETIRPGDILVVAPDRIPLAAGVPTPGGAERSSDVFETGRPPSSPRATMRLGAGTPLAAVEDSTGEAIRQVLGAVTDEDVELDSGAGRRVLVSSLLMARDRLREDQRPRIDNAVKLLRGRLSDADVVLSRKDDRRRLVIVDRRRAIADDDLRQTWRVEGVDASLDGHQVAVAERVARLGRVLGLPEGLVGLIRDAGAHHDDGKADDRFQRMLRFGESEDEVSTGLLAKSSRRTARQEELARAGSGLPSGWRHEQLSVVSMWLAGDHSDESRRVLAARLIGTTHGHGRPTFRDGTFGLVGPSVTDPARLSGERPAFVGAAVELFDVGIWEQLVEDTDLAWGVWGMAYLEAVLRAADGVVSSGRGSSPDTGNGASS